jgi:site-specific recombinase XerD
VIFIKPEILSTTVDLADRMRHARKGLLFTTLQGRSIQTQYLREMIGEKAKKSGIAKRVDFYLPRHTYLTRLYGRTKDLRLVQEVAGHADLYAYLRRRCSSGDAQNC